MAFVKEHFGGKVLRRAAKRVSARLAVLGEAEVSELEVALLVDQDVLRLQVTVDNVERVEVLEHQGNLCGVKPNRKQIAGEHCEEAGAVRQRQTLGVSERGMLDFISFVGAVSSTRIISLELLIKSSGRPGVCRHDRSQNLHCMFLVELALSAEVGEELAARDVRHQEVQVAGVL